ncbi:DUF4386 domain-containing protein [Pseudonocardia thermophila]|jgi:hypothetical protein|uniref:DUF4386 domain-containing protein n=1 Tax=Pseudonocardia thermophila TaxID=1848 RepID=UPI00248D7631|nr:DUF4386 domain-containing protein [Pseudonocardia thermophila]
MTAVDTAVPTQRLARIAGGCYLLTFVSIPTLVLYGHVHEPDFLTGGAPWEPVVVGGILEVIVAVACIGTAVALYPVLRRYAEARALGFVAARIVEGTAILVGVASLLAVVAMKRVEAGELPVARALVAFYDADFLLSQGLIPAANALLLGSVLHRFHLVPRVLPLIGFAGAALLLASDLATLFGLWDRVSPVSALAALPIAVWEFSLGVYLVVKGVRVADPGPGGIPSAPATV